MLPIYIYLLKVEILENHCLEIAQLSVNWQGNVLTLVKVWEYLQINILKPHFCTTWIKTIRGVFITQLNVSDEAFLQK